MDSFCIGLSAGGGGRARDELRMGQSARATRTPFGSHHALLTTPTPLPAPRAVIHGLLTTTPGSRRAIRPRALLRALCAALSSAVVAQSPVYSFSGNAADGLTGYMVAGSLAYTADRCGLAGGAYVSTNAQITMPAFATLPVGNQPRTVMAWVQSYASMHRNGDYFFMYGVARPPATASPSP